MNPWLPRAYAQAFETELEAQNLSKAYFTCWIVLAVFTLIMVLDFWRFKNGILTANSPYLNLFYIHLSFLWILIPIGIYNRNKTLINRKRFLYTKEFSWLVVIGAAINCLAIVLAEQFLEGAMFAYTAFIIFANFVFLFPLKERVILNISCYLAALIILFTCQSDTGVVIDNVIIATVYTLFSFTISVFHYYLQNERYLNNCLLAEKNKKLADTNEDLQNFVYAASHDLKEPVKTVKGLGRILQKSMGNKMNEKEQTCLNKMNNGMDRMDNLLTDLLQHATINKTTKKDWIALDSIIEEVLHNLQLRIDQTQANIIVHKMPTVQTTRSQMIQLFQNLISNALKFRRNDALPVIEITCSKQLNKYLLTVKDNGIGIDDKSKQEVFTMFSKVHSSKEYEGSGIGLATCKKIVAQLGGSIWISSTVGEGTIFYFTIPIPEKKATLNKQQKSANGSPFAILNSKTELAG